MRTFTLLLTLSLFQLTVYSQTQPGYLDSKYIEPASAFALSGRAVTKLPDGKILVAIQRAADSNLVVYRFNPDLTLDWTSTPVSVIQYLKKYKIVSISSDKSGRILVAGNYYYNASKLVYGNIFIVAFDSQGNVQKSLNGSNRAMITYSYDDFLGGMAVQSDGKIVLVTTSGSQIYIYRRNSDGTPDNTFASGKGSVNFSSPGTGDLATCLTLDKDDNIYVGGYYATASAGNGGSILKVLKDGAIDPTFGKLGTGRSDIISGSIGAIALQSDGKIVVTSIAGANILVVRADLNGNLDPSFNSLGYYNYNYTGSSTNVINNIVFDVYGKIYASGTYTNAAGAKVYLILKFNTSGQPDNSFISAVAKSVQGTSNSIFYSSLISNDERLLLVGEENSSASIYKVSLKSTNPTSISFASFPRVRFLGDGPFRIYTYPANLICASNDNSIAVVKNDSLFATGLGNVMITATLPGDSAYYPATTYQYLSVIPKTLFLIGKDVITANATEKYFIKDTTSVPNPYYTYEWSYYGIGAQIYTNPSDSKLVTILFNENATGGKLVCTVYYDGYYTFLDKDIVINTTLTGSTGVPSNHCDQNIVSCTDNYIDNFNINTIQSGRTGCSSSGYIDYTASRNTTTLFLGGVYSATIQLGGLSNINRYVAIWLDYDNSGDFNNTNEFLGAGFTSENMIDLDNLLIRNNSDYAGPRRLRVRTRTNGGFDPNESCPLPNESGETEDYLVTLKVQDALEAPEIITPNNDGKNDYFVVRGVDPKSSNHLSVFDRLGLVKFEADNYENTWNGMDQNGNPVNPGTYYYVFKNGKDTIRGFLEIRY